MKMIITKKSYNMLKMVSRLSLSIIVGSFYFISIALTGVTVSAYPVQVGLEHDEVVILDDINGTYLPNSAWGRRQLVNRTVHRVDPLTGLKV